MNRTEKKSYKFIRLVLLQTKQIYGVTITTWEKEEILNSKIEQERLDSFTSIGRNVISHSNHSVPFRSP